MSNDLKTPLASLREGVGLLDDTAAAHAPVALDAARLATALDNLLSNAIKFSPEGVC